MCHRLEVELGTAVEIGSEKIRFNPPISLTELPVIGFLPARAASRETKHP